MKNDNQEMTDPKGSAFDLEMEDLIEPEPLSDLNKFKNQLMYWDCYAEISPEQLPHVPQRQ